VRQDGASVEGVCGHRYGPGEVQPDEDGGVVDYVVEHRDDDFATQPSDTAESARSSTSSVPQFGVAEPSFGVSDRPRRRVIGPCSVNKRNQGRFLQVQFHSSPKCLSSTRQHISGSGVR
jgi:hypothetical protein